MKFSPFINGNKVLESVTPFHMLTLGLTFISTISISSVILQFLEPVFRVYFSFLLTFPLTLGLMIVFLIIINTNWDKVSATKILVAPILVSLLFAGLNFVSKKYGLEKTGAEYEAAEKKQGNEKSAKPDSATAIPAHTSGGGEIHLAEAVNELTKGFDPKKPIETKPPWYLNNIVVGGIVSLVSVFTDFYRAYKPVHFFSGIFIAVVFTYYIQIKIIRRLLTIKNK
jgi:hypothetical protein